MTNWRMTIHLADVFHNENMTFEERRDVIVKRILASPWLDTENTWLRELVGKLKMARTVEQFDPIWNEIYDEADADLVWIDTIGSVTRKSDD